MMDILSLPATPAGPFAPDAAADAAPDVATPFSAVLADLPAPLEATTVATPPTAVPVDPAAEMAPSWYRPPLIGGATVPTERVDPGTPVLDAALKSPIQGATVPTETVDATASTSPAALSTAVSKGTTPPHREGATVPTPIADAGDLAGPQPVATPPMPRTATVPAQAAGSGAKTALPQLGGTIVPTPLVDAPAPADSPATQDATAPTTSIHAETDTATPGPAKSVRPLAGGTTVPTPIADGPADAARPAAPGTTKPTDAIDPGPRVATLGPAKGALPPAGGTTVPTPVADGSVAITPAAARGDTVPTPLVDAAADPAAPGRGKVPSPRAGGATVPMPVADGPDATTTPAAHGDDGPKRVVDAGAAVAGRRPAKFTIAPAAGTTVPTSLADPDATTTRVDMETVSAVAIPTGGMPATDGTPALLASLQDISRPDAVPVVGRAEPAAVATSTLVAADEPAPVPGEEAAPAAPAARPETSSVPPDPSSTAGRSDRDRQPWSSVPHPAGAIRSAPSAAAIDMAAAIGKDPVVAPAIVGDAGRSGPTDPARPAPATLTATDAAPKGAAPSLASDEAETGTARPAVRKRSAVIMDAAIPAMPLASVIGPPAEVTQTASRPISVRTPPSARNDAATKRPTDAAPAAAVTGEADAPVLSALIAIAAGKEQPVAAPVAQTGVDRPPEPVAASSTVTMLAARGGMGQAAAKAPASAMRGAAPVEEDPASPSTRRIVGDGAAGTDAVATPATPAETASPPAAAKTDIAGAQLAAGATDRQVEVARHAAWADGIARDIASAGAGAGTTRFTVAPAALGAVSVELTRSENGTDVRLSAATGGARDALEQARPQLVAEARAQGLHIREALVDLGGDTSGNGAGQGQHRGEPHASQAMPTVPLDRTDTATVSETNSLTPGSYGGGVGGDAGAQARQQQAQHQTSQSRAARAGADQPAPAGRPAGGDAGRPADGRYA